MQKEAVAEVAVPEIFSEEKHREENGFRDFIIGFFSVLFELFSLARRKVIAISVIFGLWFHKRVLAPASVLLGALAGYASSLSRDLFYKMRHFSHRATVAMQGVRANRFAIATSMIAILFIIIATSAYSVGVKITVDGKVLGYADSREDFDAALTFVEDRASEILERPYSITSNIRFEVGIIERDDIISEETVYGYFFSRINEISTLYALTVDGEVIGASRNRETLQAMLDELLYVNDANVTARFAKDVEIVQTEVDTSKLLSYEEIREKLTSKIHSKREYTIKYGDTIDKIAKENGITSEELIKLNPGISSSKLRAGRKLTVAKEIPFLSVEAIRRVEYTESIPFETEKVNDSSLYKGTTKVVVKGQYGQRKIVADVTYVDNKEESRNILSSVVTKQPVTKVIHVGTKERPKTMATGRLSRPVKGAIISSNYGMRRGSMHKGVDFAARTGTRISAADGGTVTWAGWKSGGWGYLVVINHGNGIETYYAHNSKVTVRVGQKVAKGEQIAKMGSTGNSSGPHVHFEIHVNGRYVNPWRYIS